MGRSFFCWDLSASRTGLVAKRSLASVKVSPSCVAVWLWYRLAEVEKDLPASAGDWSAWLKRWPARENASSPAELLLPDWVNWPALKSLPE